MGCQQAFMGTEAVKRDRHQIFEDNTIMEEDVPFERLKINSLLIF